LLGNRGIESDVERKSVCGVKSDAIDSVVCGICSRNTSSDGYVVVISGIGRCSDGSIGLVVQNDDVSLRESISGIGTVDNSGSDTV
jgi:hypothetical protein